jgi:hypothetical protein
MKSLKQSLETYIADTQIYKAKVEQFRETAKMKKIELYERLGDTNRSLIKQLESMGLTNIETQNFFTIQENEIEQELSTEIDPLRANIGEEHAIAEEEENYIIDYEGEDPDQLNDDDYDD